MMDVLRAQQGLLLAFLVTVGLAMVPRGNDVISCLQGRVRCYDNYTCGDLLDDMDDYCDVSASFNNGEMIFHPMRLATIVCEYKSVWQAFGKWITDERVFLMGASTYFVSTDYIPLTYNVGSCETIHKKQCQSILSSLQTNRYFRSCTCDPNDFDATDCREIQNRIFMHACVTENGIAPDPPWHRHASPQQGAPSPEELEAIEQSLDRELSCIGVRQLCLKNMECHEAFKTFQGVCEMKRDTGICVATDRKKCFKAIETIRPSGLFDCECKSGMKTYTLAKCERIRSRLALNPCLVSVPYYVYSAKPYESSYTDLVRIITSAGEPRNFDIDSTCVQAFIACNDDSTCRIRLAESVNACHWDKATNRCDRIGCLEAIRRFYLLARPEKTHALLFCRCKLKDRKCETVQAAMFPTCSVMEEPPPSCLDILHRCYADEDCRTRWYAYQQYCAYDKKVIGCPAGTARCRNSQAGIMGTILTTNCTCTLSSEIEQAKCVDARKQLQDKNLCREMAFDEFHSHPATTPHTYWADAAAVSESHGQYIWKDCMRELGHKTPLFMDTPTVIRRYNNHSDCSEVCHCLLNGTLLCKKLPCGPNLSCTTRSKRVYAHGASFAHPERGLCRCIRGELVCAKYLTDVKLKPGLFLHVGYSLSDQYLVEGNSGVAFSARQVGDNFGAILNSDSAEQFCSLTLYRQTEANLIFEIKVAENSPLKNKEEGCITPAKMLSNKVNSRDPVIVTDAELSIIKVAQLERVFYYMEAAPTVQSLLSLRGAAWRISLSWPTLVACLLLFMVPWSSDVHHGAELRSACVSDRQNGIHSALRIYSNCDSKRDSVGDKRNMADNPQTQDVLRTSVVSVCKHRTS